MCPLCRSGRHDDCTGWYGFWIKVGVRADWARCVCDVRGHAS